MTNDHLVLVMGETNTGKSASLKGIRDAKGVMYLNCEAGKKLPFSNEFKSVTMTDPLLIPQWFDKAEDTPEIKTVIIDSVTFLMDMFESVYVLPSKDTMKGWQNYQQYLKNIMIQKVAKSTKQVIITAHTLTLYNEAAQAMETKVPIKGALKNHGVESFFSTIVATKKVRIKDLEKYGSDYLNITEVEEMLGFKYCFQTQLTKETIMERIRAPMGMWSVRETYIDNNVQFVLDRLNEYYK